MAAQYGLSGKLGWLHEPAWLHWKGHALLLDPNKPLVCAPVQLHGKREATTYIADYVGHTSGCRTLCEMQTFSLRMGVRSNYLGIEREKEKKTAKNPGFFGMECLFTWSAWVQHAEKLLMWMVVKEEEYEMAFLGSAAACAWFRGICSWPCRQSIWF